MQVDYSVELGRNDPALELPWCSEDSSIRYYDLKKHPDLVLQVPEASAYPELGEFLARINAPEFPLQTAKCDAWPSREILPEEEIFGAKCKFASYIDLVFTDRETQSSFEKHEEFAKDLCRLLKRAPDLSAVVDFIIRRCHYHDENQARSLSGSGRESCPDNNFVPAAGSQAGGSFKVFTAETSEQQRIDKDFHHTSVGPDGSCVPEDKNNNATVTNAGKTSISPPGTLQPEKMPIATAKAHELKKTLANEPGGIPDAQYFGNSRAGFCLTAYIVGFGNSSDEAGKRWSIALTLVQHALVQVAHREPAL